MAFFPPNRHAPLGRGLQSASQLEFSGVKHHIRLRIDLGWLGGVDRRRDEEMYKHNMDVVAIAGWSLAITVPVGVGSCICIWGPHVVHVATASSGGLGDLISTCDALKGRTSVREGKGKEDRER
jgi:hypothetical protein